MGIEVLITEDGPRGVAILLAAVLAAVGFGGPYVAYLPIRTARRLRRQHPGKFGDEVRGTVVWLAIALIAGAAIPMPGNTTFGVGVVIVVLCSMIGVIGLAHEFERQRRE